jgi:hypothetical protein
MATDESADLPYGENTFFAAGTWFLVNLQAIKPDHTFHVSGIHEIVNSDHKQEGFRYTPLFTDEDLAKRAVESLRKLGIVVVPFPCSTLDQVELLFQGLMSIGRQDIAYDPGETRVETIPIADSLRAIRRQREQE